MSTRPENSQHVFRAAMLLAGVAILATVGCRKTANSGSQTPPAERPTIGLITGSSDRELDIGVKAELDGHQNLNRMRYEAVSAAPNPSDPASDQIVQIERLISDKVKGLIVVPSDPVKVLPALKKAQEAGVHVVTVGPALDADSLKSEELQIAHVSVDFKAAAAQLVGELNKLDLPGDEVLIVGNGERANFLEFHDGFMDSLGKGTLQVVAAEQVSQGDANTLITAVQGKVARQLKKNPDLAAVLCCDFTTTKGALRARARELEKEDGHSFVIFGFATNRNYSNLIEDGAEMIAVVHHDQMTVTAVSLALEAISSGNETNQQVNVPVELARGKGYLEKNPQKETAEEPESPAEPGS